MVLFSASNQNLDKVINKMTFMLVALGIMWGVAVRPQTLMQLAVPWLYCRRADAVGRGAVWRSGQWLAALAALGVTRIQPSGSAENHGADDAGLVLPKHENALRWHHYLVGAVIIIIPSLFILKRQYDLAPPR